MIKTQIMIVIIYKQIGHVQMPHHTFLYFKEIFVVESEGHVL